VEGTDESSHKRCLWDLAVLVGMAPEQAEDGGQIPCALSHWSEERVVGSSSKLSLWALEGHWQPWGKEKTDLGGCTMLMAGSQGIEKSDAGETTKVAGWGKIPSRPEECWKCRHQVVLIWSQSQDFPDGRWEVSG
jgi:hypothetical protein